jgi:hypothetical protein
MSDAVERLKRYIDGCEPGTCDNCDDIREVLAENKRLRGRLEKKIGQALEQAGRVDTAEAKAEAALALIADFAPHAEIEEALRGGDDE